MPARGVNKMPPKVVYPPGCKEIAPDMSKEELLKRLKLLAKWFQEMGQDDNEKYKGLAIFLASELFLDHSSKDVKLLIACCIADIFRIFAPEAPYLDDGHVKEIFMFFVEQLRGLEDTEAPSFKRYFYLLENLAWVKSFNICLEFEDNQEIFCRLYKLVFSIVSAKHSSKVKNFMLDMMCPLITEADSVSQELLDIILLNIIDPNRGLNKESYQLAKDLIRRTSNAIEPYIQAFFNNALILGKTSESEVSDHLFPLIYELNQISPSVLLSVLPQLEYKLKSNDDKERKSVTRLLSKMFSDKNSDLANTNKSLWLCYLGRFNDINIQVRTLCVQQSQHFILNHPELIKDITEQLKSRLHDSEETVRMECVQALVNTAKKDLSSVNTQLLQFIKERTLDKKFRIRKEALLGLGWIYKKCLTKEEPDLEEMKRVGWIRDKIIHGYYQLNLDDRIVIERIFKLCLVPYMMDPDARMKTLYHLYVNLDEYAIKAFNEMLRCQFNAVTLMRQLLDAIAKEDGAGKEEAIAVKVQSLTRMLPDQPRSHENMKKLAHMVKEDDIIRKNLRNLVSVECTCKKAESCVQEMLKRMGHATPQNTFYTSIKMLLERIAPVHIDISAMKILMKLVNDSVSGIADIDDDVHDCGYKGMKLLLSLSTVYPGAFDNDEVFRYLLPFLKHEEEDVVDLSIQIFTNTGANIQEEHEEIYENMLPVLVELAKEGTPEQAKHAVICINTICADKMPILTDIFEELKDALDTDALHYQTALVSLGHIAELGGGDFFAVQMKNTIVRSIVKDLLMKDREESSKTPQKKLTESWCPDDKIPKETMAKMRAMKLMVRWLMGLRQNTMAENSGKSTLRMLYTIVLHDGDLMETGHLSISEMSRLRLQAGCCMLKLAQEPVYADLISPEQFQGLAILINDAVYEVRTRFAAKLHKGLLTLKLKLEYMSIFCLVANDPLKERRIQVKAQLLANVNKRRDLLKKAPANDRMFQLLPDYVLPYVVHLLAHDPEFKDINDIEVLNSLKDCLWFIMEPLMTKNDNYSYNFYAKILDDIKHAKDAEDPDNEEVNHKLYAICDLAMGIIATKTTTFVLKDFPVDPVLPSKLFIRDKSMRNTKFYLPQEFAFSPPKKKQAVALMHGAAHIAQKPNKLLNGVSDAESPASPAGSISGKSDKSNDSKLAKKEPAKRSRVTKPKGPNAKKARLSSPPSATESPVPNGLNLSSSSESSPAPVKVARKSGGKLVQAKLAFSKDSGKENVKSPAAEPNSGSSKKAAKTSGNNKPKGGKKAKKDVSEETTSDLSDSTENEEKTETTKNVKKDTAVKGKKDNIEKAVKNKNKESTSSPAKKATPKVLKRTLSKSSVRSRSVSPVKGSPGFSSQGSSQSSKGSIVVKLSPKKKNTSVKKKNVKVVSKKTNISSPKKSGLNNKSRTKSTPTKPSPAKSKLSSAKKSLQAKLKGKVTPTKILKKARKSLSSPSKSSSSSPSSLKSGPVLSQRNSKSSKATTSGGRKLTKSPAASPKVGQKRPAGGSAKNTSPAKKGKPTPPVKNVKKVARKLSPELDKSKGKKRALSNPSPSSKKKTKMTKSGSQSSSTTVPSTSSSKSPSPKKTIPTKSLPPKKRPNVRRAGIPNGTSDGSSTQSSSSTSSSPRKSPRKPIPNKKFKDVEDSGPGIKRKAKATKR